MLLRKTLQPTGREGRASPERARMEGQEGALGGQGQNDGKTQWQWGENETAASGKRSTGGDTHGQRSEAMKRKKGYRKSNMSSCCMHKPERYFIPLESFCSCLEAEQLKTKYPHIVQQIFRNLPSPNHFFFNSFNGPHTERNSSSEGLKRQLFWLQTSDACHHHSLFQILCSMHKAFLWASDGMAQAPPVSRDDLHKNEWDFLEATQ